MIQCSIESETTFEVCYLHAGKPPALLSYLVSQMQPEIPFANRKSYVSYDIIGIMM